MVRFYRLSMVYVIICAIVMGTDLYSCVVTFLNNGSGSVLTLDHNNVLNKKKLHAPSSFAMISRGKSRRLGKSDELAHFTIYTKHPNNNLFISTYEVKQNDCSNNGNPHITLSDIKNKTGDSNLFTIIDTSQHHTSMVRQLPNMKKADIYREEPSGGCSACGDK